MPTTANCPPEVQVFSTLAALAYTASTQVLLQQMASPALPMQQAATLAWGPINLGSNRVYVVRGLETADQRPRVVVAIRGTVIQPESVFEDADLTMVGLPWATARYATARISQGICYGLQHIQAMRWGAGMQSLLAFLQALPPQTEIVVTGHSQGGCLTSVVALWLHEMLGPDGPQVVPCTFAGETAGEANFADAVNAAFPTGSRYYNVIDVVPKAWNETDLGTIAELFPGAAPKLDLLWKGLLDVAKGKASGKGFVQPARAFALPGEVYDKTGLLQFADEIGAQHSSLYYMWLTGVSLAGIHAVSPAWQPPA